MSSVIGYVGRTEDGPSVVYNEPVKKMNQLFVAHLQRLYGENGRVVVWKCGFGDSQTKVWVYHHDFAPGPYEALLIEGNMEVVEYFVIITTLSGDMLAFRCDDPADVEKKIGEFFGPHTISRRLGENLILRAKGIFVPETVPQALVFRI